MSVSSLTASLPSLAGALPDVFRRSDSVPPHADAARSALDAPADNEAQRHAAARADDSAKLLARRAVLGPLTYERRSAPRADVAAAPIGMRGAHLDVRG